MLGEKTVFFKFDFFFWLLTQNMIMTNDHIRFADIKKHFFFQIILLEKYIDKMTMSRSSIFRLIFRGKADDLMVHEKIFFWSKTTQKMLKNKNSVPFFTNPFCFEQTKKKRAHKRKFSPSRQRWCKKLTFFWLLLTFVLFS